MRRAVAPLVQAVARGVEAERDPVLHDGELHLITGGALQEPVQPVDALQALHDGLFDDLLAVRHGKQPGIEAVALDGEGPVLRDDALPRQRARALEQLLKAQRLKAAEIDQHAFADAQVDIGAGDGLRPAGKAHAAVLRGDAGKLHAAQLVGDRPLQPEQAGDGQRIVHGRSPVFLSRLSYNDF